MTNESLKLFARTNTGWLLPNGTLVPCTKYNHLHVLRSNQEACDLVPYLDEGRKELDQMADDCQELSDECGGNHHGEWHRLDMLEDEVRSKTYKLLYDAGAIRLGWNEYDGEICAMGKSEHLNSALDKLRKIVNNLYSITEKKFDLKIEPINEKTSRD